MTISERLQLIRADIQSACFKVNRDPAEVNIVAVTKYGNEQLVRQVLATGLDHIGENRVQDALVKKAKVLEPATWHFIGHLQTNKVKDVLPHFDYIHSLDRSSLAKEINKRGLELQRKINCFVQVNVSGEESKYGLSPEQVEKFLLSLAQFKHIRVIGLMTMAPYVEDPEQTRPIFRQLRELRDLLRKQSLEYAPLQHLSMGMSNDYLVAIEEGATFVRLGTTLVGPTAENIE